MPVTVSEVWLQYFSEYAEPPLLEELRIYNIEKCLWESECDCCCEMLSEAKTNKRIRVLSVRLYH